MRVFEPLRIALWVSLFGWAVLGFAWSDNRNAAGESVTDAPPQIELRVSTGPLETGGGGRER